MRHPQSQAHSIEHLFKDVQTYLPNDIEVKVCVNQYISTGILRRLFDIVRARQHQSDVNHVTGDIHFVTYLLDKRRTILTILDCEILNRSTGLKRMLLYFFWFWLPIKRSSLITVISEATKNELKKYIKTDHCSIEVIPCSVSHDFQPHSQPFNTKCPRILQIGTKKNKNIERVAAALEGLSCQLVIIGQLSKTQRNALQKHKVNFTTHVNISRADMILKYQQADIVMFASLYEGFGLPIVEANAVGRPVISSCLYSMPEVGGEEGACYVDPYNVGEIRAAVEKISNNSKYRNKLIEKGFQNSKRFRPETVSAQYASLYKRLYEQKI